MKENNSKNNHSVQDEDELTVKQLKDGLDKLDQWNPVSAPDIQWIEQQIELEKKRIRKKQWKDLLTFIAVAILVLSVMIAVVYREPILFVYIQLAGLLLLPFALKKPGKKVRIHEHK